MRSGDFFELRSTTAIRGHPYKLFKRQCACTVRSSFFTERLLIFGIVCLVTLLDFLHSLHLSPQLNVSTSAISSTLHSFLRAGIVSLTFLLVMFYFILFFRATVSALSHLPYTICSSCTLCCMCSWQINDDDDDDDDDVSVDKEEYIKFWKSYLYPDLDIF